ncbi:MAG: aldo/keto reductase [Provencibacterium sp.]|jgi:myo-inositol catabolism protein IolS|nr:aldo/keto reductase [Provencibacterium sp.]
MEKRRLGNSDLLVSKLGMGCWPYGGGAYWGEQSQKDVNEVVALALDSGVNLFDTAEAYNDGASESALGEALRGRRAEAVIVSKVSTSNTHAETLRAHCEASLRRLQTDYIDLYLLHWPINPKAIEHFSSDRSLCENPPTVEEAFHTLSALRKEGKIRAIGVSNHGLGQMQEIAKTGVPVVANELPYNLISRAIEGGIAGYCEQNGIGIIGYMALQQGILTGLYEKISDLSVPQLHSRHFHYSRAGEMARHGSEGAEPEIEALLAGMKTLSQQLGVSVAALSLSWTLQNSAVSATLVGSRTAEELRMNLAAADYPMAAEVRAELDRLSQPVLDKLGYSPDYYESLSNSRIY